jgi:hypothetical protein
LVEKELRNCFKYPLRLAALALVVATAVGIAAFVPQMNSAAPQLIGMQAATQDTALPQAVCWSAPHSGMVALAVVAIFAITYCAIHFKVVYGSRVFLGSQPRFAFLLVVLKLVVCGICTLFSSHAEVCGATLLLASAVLLAYNFKEQPCMDCTDQGELANNVRTSVYASCTVTGAFGLISYAVNQPQDATITIAWACTVPIVAVCAFMVNRQSAEDKGTERAKNVKFDFKSLLNDSDESQIGVDQMANFFRARLYFEPG